MQCSCSFGDSFFFFCSPRILPPVILQPSVKTVPFVSFADPFSFPQRPILIPNHAVTSRSPPPRSLLSSSTYLPPSTSCSSISFLLSPILFPPRIAKRTPQCWLLCHLPSRQILHIHRLPAEALLLPVHLFLLLLRPRSPPPPVLTSHCGHSWKMMSSSEQQVKKRSLSIKSASYVENWRGSAATCANLRTIVPGEFEPHWPAPFFLFLPHVSVLSHLFLLSFVLCLLSCAAILCDAVLFFPSFSVLENISWLIGRHTKWDANNWNWKTAKAARAAPCTAPSNASASCSSSDSTNAVYSPANNDFIHHHKLEWM